MWTNGKEFVNEQSFAQYINFTFDIPWALVKCHVLLKLEAINQEFRDWLDRFINKNNIKFPFVDKFFSIIIYNSLHTDKKNVYDRNIDIKKYIMIIKNSILNLVRENNILGEAVKSDKSLNSEIYSVENAQLLDFEGNIWFENIRN